MLSSTVADTKQPATSKKKSVLTTVSPGMKQRVPPGWMDNGFGFELGFELPDDISDLDGLAKIIQPNTTGSATPVYFDQQFRSSTIPNMIALPSVSSNSLSFQSSSTTTYNKQVLPSATFPTSVTAGNYRSSLKPRHMSTAAHGYTLKPQLSSASKSATTNTTTIISSLKPQPLSTAARGYSLKPPPTIASKSAAYKHRPCDTSHSPPSPLKPPPPAATPSPRTRSKNKQLTHRSKPLIHTSHKSTGNYYITADLQAVKPPVLEQTSNIYFFMIPHILVLTKRLFHPSLVLLPHHILIVDETTKLLSQIKLYIMHVLIL